MSQLIRKLKRNKKTAYKFGFKLTYHEITLTHDPDYTPSSLVIRWSRGHRQVVSTKAIWTPGPQPNAKGQLGGNGIFDPPCTVELLVTLYKEPKSDFFEEKDYKFVLEDEGDVGGRKALGVFSINIGQFADMLGSTNDVTMEMKSLVKKVSEALVDVTIKSDFLKTGKVGDDDMMSTWSAMSGLVDDDDDEQSDLTADSPAGGQLETSNSELNLGASRNLKESLSFFDMKPAESYYDFISRNAPDGAIDSQGAKVSLEHLKKAKTIGLFFAAHLSPQCKFFLSTLDSFYNSLYEVRPGDFEVIFISCDHNDAEMLDFMQDSGVCYPGMKPFSLLAEALKEKFDVSDIPQVIVVNPQTGEPIDRDGRLKIERCGGNEDCFEVIDYWVAGKVAPLRAEIELNVKPIGHLSPDIGDQKAKIVSKEEKKRQEKLEKERKKKEEEERRRQERLEKEEKKRLEREEKKKQRDREKSEKKAKRSSVSHHHADIAIQEGPVSENGAFDQNENEPTTQAEVNLEPKPKPTLFELAGGHGPGNTGHETTEPELEPEPVVEVPTKKKEKDKGKDKDKEESGIFKMPKGLDNQLKEAKSRIAELEQNNKNLSEKSDALYEAKVQLENEKDDLQEKVIELTNNVEDFTEQVRELTENRDTLAKENQEKSRQVDSLQEERLGLKEDLNGARSELETVRQQLSQSKLKLIEYETDKQAKDEERQQLLATTELQGWLYKRGVRGMTGKKWRRRFFHMGQGFKLYYYKTSSMQLPQGYIDLEKVKQVGTQSEDKQDKNKSSFNIEVEGRIFELQAMDVAMRDQWINAVNFLVQYRSKYRVDVMSLSASKEAPASGEEVPAEK